MWNAISPKKLGVGKLDRTLKYVENVNNLSTTSSELFFLLIQATYNFDGKVKHGLMFNIGDIVQIQEECLGQWDLCH